MHCRTLGMRQSSDMRKWCPGLSVACPVKQLYTWDLEIHHPINSSCWDFVSLRLHFLPPPTVENVLSCPTSSLPHGRSGCMATVREYERWPEALCLCLAWRRDGLSHIGDERIVRSWSVDHGSSRFDVDALVWNRA